MKKIAKGILLAVLLIFVLSGCGKKYEVIFMPNGGTLVSGELKQSVEKNGTATPPVVENGTMILQWDGDYSNITEDTFINAVWVPSEHQVVFNLNGGTLISGETKQTVKDGQAAVAPEVTNGNKLLNWDCAFDSVSEDLIVNAMWGNPSFTVCFESGVYGIESCSVQVEDGQSATPAAMTREGYSLVGWDQDISSVHGDMTVKAIWERNTLSSQEIATYADRRTATVYANLKDGTSTGTGTGFFIDEEGTLITNYHVIEFATGLYVKMNDGSQYDVSKVVNFSEKYDIAVLKVQIPSGTQCEYFPIAQAEKGENVYAIGSALGDLTGSITSGIISSTDRSFGVAECYQMDVAISHGNSGGPLVNRYGDAVGINAYSYTNGESLNFAVKLSMLDKLGTARNYSVSDYVEWWQRETSRSYRPTYFEDTDYYKQSIINTYTTVTGAPCILSTDSEVLDEVTDYAEGYDANFWVFMYDYEKDQYDQYVDYLKELGFAYESDLSEQTASQIENWYYNEMTDTVVVLLVNYEQSDWGQAYGGNSLLITTLVL